MTGGGQFVRIFHLKRIVVFTEAVLDARGYVCV